MRPTSLFARALSAALVLAITMPALPVSAAPGKGLSLGREYSGQAAIEALGPDLATVASRHGKSTSELKRALRDDKHLFVDRRGALLYREAPLEAAPVAGPDLPWTNATYALDRTFALHSNPGSKRTIFLDFDGHVLSGTGWNYYNNNADINAPAWDIDGLPGSFSDAEKTAIQKIWRRVAEDYAPFDVDVTTEQPSEDVLLRSSLTDQYFGVRVLISPISSYFGRYGGISYVDVYDQVGNNNPSLVFPENLSNGEKYIAEASSHEAGHSLGLLHDGTTTGLEYYGGQGTGETGWAPIMGNSYSRALSQWSRGEYANANNREDDFTIIASGGCPLRSDDHGDLYTPTSITPTTAIAANGIAGPGDADAITFSAGQGLATLNVAPTSLGSDLDIALELRDSFGVLIASANPTETLAASISVALVKGSYTLSVRGTGKGDPLTTGYSAYGSAGAWRLTGTVADPGPATGIAPVASLTSSAASGTAPLPVTFDASGSYDPDGTALTYAWDFGDGTSATGAMVSHTYTSAGTYHAILTVRDASGMTSTISAQIIVRAANIAPTSAITVNAARGIAPLVVAFDGSGSRDADGRIVDWAWDFGDGASATGATTSHSYLSAGTYIARLRVTDDSGSVATSSVTIIVDPVPAATMSVASISVSTITQRNGLYGQGLVRVVDASGRPVQGATVTGSWSGAVTGVSSAITGTDGVAVLKSKTFKRTGSLTLSVTNVTKAGHAYDSASNTVTKVSYSTPLRSPAFRIPR